MTINEKTTIRVAALARLKLSQAEIQGFRGDLEKIFRWIDQLSEVNIEGVEPVYNVCGFTLPLRLDESSAEDRRDDLLANAPEHRDGFFLVPKVISQDTE